MKSLMKPKEIMMNQKENCKIMKSMKKTLFLMDNMQICKKKSQKLNRL